MIDRYLNILKESLEKKLVILDRIIEVNKQMEAGLVEDPDGESVYEKYAEPKDAMVDELTKLDEGFESVYDRIREGLPENKEQYKEEIMYLQLLISHVMDKTTTIQAQEQRLKNTIDRNISMRKSKIKESRGGLKTVQAYGQQRYTIQSSESFFMDTKK